MMVESPLPQYFYLINRRMIEREDFVKSFMIVPLCCETSYPLLRETNDLELFKKLCFINKQEGNA